MRAFEASSYLFSSNSSYIEEIYEQFLIDPSKVTAPWRHYFEALVSSQTSHGQQAIAKTSSSNGATPATTGIVAEAAVARLNTDLQQWAQQPRLSTSVSSDTGSEISESSLLLERKQSRVAQLVNAYRSRGHQLAKLDPLDLTPSRQTPDLDLSYYGLTQADLDIVFNSTVFTGLKETTLREIYQALIDTYCRSIGFEYMHIADSQILEWIQHKIEIVRAEPHYSAETKLNILQNLTAADGLEKYLGSKYVGQKRFSLEGGDSFIPALCHIVNRSCTAGVKEVILGMAHRGRLNVLINVLGKMPNELFQQFEGSHGPQDSDRSGDVKYHLGFASYVQTPSGTLHTVLAFNPSHLEIISPVAEGSVRARQQRRRDTERMQVIPILVHGDAAFAGQGVVMETFSFSQAKGYTTGGTIHIVINNQIGFTTNPTDARSTMYCTDIAKMVQAPIFHVNGDDPEAVVFVTELAFEFRMQFKRDVVIDLVCYRRHGHNEADEPAATQPVMYQRIKQHETTRAIYAEQLIREGVIDQAQADKLVNDYRDKLDANQPVVSTVPLDKNKYTLNWTPYLNQEWRAPYDSRVDISVLKQLATSLETLPDKMTLQPQVARMMDERRLMTAEQHPLNWGYAETLAYATLLTEGYLVRLSGQDCGRGTFAHRHVALHNYQTDEIYIPLQHLSDKQAPFFVIDSILSEEAVLGFEYGYAGADPAALVIWEAQFGDFANGAQVVIDQFISSGEQKWGRLCGLVMLLPHGFEGAGPEHSSARLERYLQLCAQNNMQVCVPTTPSQIYHLLRRQMKRPFRKPLIVMTPKSLLRHKLAVSSFQDLAEGQFELVIPEIDDIKPNDVKRVIFCSGKVYYDLLESRREQKLSQVAIIRIEQLYPFPKEEIAIEFKRYKKAKEIIWCQEEPRNQGAWYSSQHYLQDFLDKGQTLSYAGRDSSASPAVGSMSLHVEQQKALVSSALGLDT